MRRMFSRPAGLLAVLVAVAVGVAATLLLAHSSHSSPRSTPTARLARAAAPATAATHAAALPPPPSGFAIPKPRLLGRSRDVTRWAPVLHATEAHVSPAASSPVVVAVAKQTPEGTNNLVVADGELTRGGTVWVHARLAVLPDGRTGWVPRAALGGWSFVNTRLVIDRTRLRLTLYRAGRAIFRAPIGVGKPSTPTPAGVFYVRDRLTAYASPEYGPLAFGTSARSEYETDWPAGGFIGIHGTDEPQLIPGRISHGCIRLKNTAILALGRLLPVGTPVIIR
jgi:lipoprotein-anchoring transpeptidase ErfK/SrfK